VGEPWTAQMALGSCAHAGDCWLLNSTSSGECAHRHSPTDPLILTVPQAPSVSTSTRPICRVWLVSRTWTGGHQGWARGGVRQMGRDSLLAIMHGRPLG